MHVICRDRTGTFDGCIRMCSLGRLCPACAIDVACLRIRTAVLGLAEPHDLEWKIPSRPSWCLAPASGRFHELAVELNLVSPAKLHRAMHEETSVQRDPETGLPNYLCVGNRIKTARAQVICTLVDSAFLQSMTDSTSQVHQTAAETSGSLFFNVVPELSPGTASAHKLFRISS